jgi:hypothetical protein
MNPISRSGASAERRNLVQQLRRSAEAPLRLLAATVALLLVAAFLAGCGKDSTKSDERRVLYYQSAMHPWIKSDKPGRCTICGMELTPVYEGQAGFDMSGDVITLSSNSVRVLNVQTVEARVQPLAKTLSVAGTIDDNDSTHRVLSAYVAGRIEKLQVAYVGAEVKAGEPLAELYSPMLLTAVRDFLVIQRGAGDASLAAAASTRLKQLGLTAHIQRNELRVSTAFADQRDGGGEEYLRRSIRAGRRETLRDRRLLYDVVPLPRLRTGPAMDSRGPESGCDHAFTSRSCRDRRGEVH